MPAFSSLGITDIVVRLYFKNLSIYRSHDKLVETFMRRAIAEYYGLLPAYDGKEEELEEVLNYRTRLYEAATVQTLTIWGGNKGVNGTLGNDSALKLASTLRLAFGEGDIIDTYNDDYDPRVLELKGLDPGTLEKMLHSNRTYRNIIRHLDQLIHERFNTFHSSSYYIYESGRREVEDGQAEDIELHLLYLKGEFEKVRDSYPTLESTTELLVRKLGLMGSCAAQIIYEESDGRKHDLKEALGQFYTYAGVLLQFWTNDVQKLWMDIEKLDTNPIITYALCKYPDARRIDRSLVLRLLRSEPDLLRRMADPYRKRMEEALKEIRKFRFDPRTHQGLALMIDRWANKLRYSLISM